MLATGKTFFSVASGLMMRPLFKPFFLMYTQIFFVTSVRGIDFPPQTAANASLSFFGANRPTPFFFMVAFVIVVFVVFATVVFAVVLVVVVISSEERRPPPRPSERVVDPPPPSPRARRRPHRLWPAPV